MKQLNPFQAQGLLDGKPQNYRRERFKKVFFAVLAAHVLLFLTLLIQGCRSGQQVNGGAPASNTVTARN